MEGRQITSTAATALTHREHHDPASAPAIEHDANEMDLLCVNLSDDEDECSDSEVNEGGKQAGLYFDSRLHLTAEQAKQLGVGFFVVIALIACLVLAVSAIGQSVSGNKPGVQHSYFGFR